VLQFPLRLGSDRLGRGGDAWHACGETHEDTAVVE
jgi:hypothetical protein